MVRESNDGDAASLKHAMIRYFEYFANKIPAGNASTIPRWTEFYQDSSGQGKMTTVALPVYADDDRRSEFSMALWALMYWHQTLGQA